MDPKKKSATEIIVVRGEEPRKYEGYYAVL